MSNKDEKYEFDCPVLPGKTIITITHGAELVNEPRPHFIINAPPFFYCEHILDCGIAIVDDQGNIDDQSWESCPEYITRREEIFTE